RASTFFSISDSSSDHAFYPKSVSKKTGAAANEAEQNDPKSCSLMESEEADALEKLSRSKVRQKSGVGTVVCCINCISLDSI
ncbi:hypothetical protein, partial [Burkholderia cepacia]|uniref:hypothetical protein n=1 Tax=Burkholderia cepacia TaxID=292 RepID=UPI001C616AA2